MSKLYNLEEGKYPDKKKNTETCFYGKGWKVEKINEEYYLKFISAKQGGEEEQIKITKEIFDEVQKNEFTLREIIQKFNLIYNK